MPERRGCERVERAWKRCAGNYGCSKKCLRVSFIMGKAEKCGKFRAFLVLEFRFRAKFFIF